MSDAQRDPHVLVSARIGSNEKLLALPSHRARWGWVVMLGQAKLQRPPGLFTSMAQVRFLAGEFRDCVSAWIDARLLHAAPVARECPRCVEAFPDLQDASYVVHDWKAHQERSRTSEWRDAKGIPNGHVNAAGDTSGKHDGKQRGNNGETLAPRAPTRALQSQSLSQSSTTEGVQGEPNAWDAFYARTGEVPGPKFRGWLDELSEAHSEARVVSMIGRIPKTQSNPTDYLKAVRDALRAEDMAEERAEREREKAAIAKKRAPLPRMVSAEDISIEEAKRLAAEYIASTKGAA